MSIKESALTAITAISNSDFVRAVTSAGASRRITVANLAKQIVEGYTGSSLAGESQSVKAALDSLNSKTLLTLTRTENQWVDATSFGRLYAYKRGNMLFLNCNLGITTAGSISDYVKIGSISGWRAVSTVYASPSCQSDGSKSATIMVESNGDIKIYGRNLIEGFYRCFMTVPAS